jgi:DNA-binding response OmpR family regulator
MASILIISEDWQRRTSIRYTLEQSGHGVVEADSGVVGICLLQQEPTEVVLAEALQPRHSGLDTLLEVRKAAPAVRIIALSGWRFGGQHKARAAAKALGVQYLVEPPLTRRTLLKAVSEVLTPVGPAS